MTTAQPATAPPSSTEDVVEKVAIELERILTRRIMSAKLDGYTLETSKELARAAIAAIPDDKAELVAVLRDVYNSACTNKDAFLKARVLLAKHTEAA